MACYHPLEGYRSRERNESGKRSIVFSVKDGYADLPVSVPCGQCIGCRLDRSKQWAIRMQHEASLHQDNCFITLTYSDDKLPGDGGLCLRDFQLFMKRLRKRFSGQLIRFFHCGEYGDDTSRPHYHSILFGCNFSDRVLFSKSDSGHSVFVSPTLTDLWGLGHAVVGDFTFESAAYCARYVMKKINGDRLDVDACPTHYARLDESTGEIHTVEPEYATMSRRPGIGQGWFRKFSSDVFPDDFVVHDGMKVKTPNFYLNLHQKVHGEKLIERLKLARIKKARKHKADQTPERLRVKERVKLAQISTLKRS